MSDRLANTLSDEPGYEHRLVDCYTRRLLELARRHLRDRVRRRVDLEDVVQSVYRSFFRRLNEGQFSFEDSLDVWRLLAAMTFHKARNAVKFHQRHRRDVRLDVPLDTGDTPSGPAAGAMEDTPDRHDLEMLFDCLEQLLAQLPENHRDIVLLRLDGPPIERIAPAVVVLRDAAVRRVGRAGEARDVRVPHEEIVAAPFPALSNRANTMSDRAFIAQQRTTFHSSELFNARAVPEHGS